MALNIYASKILPYFDYGDQLYVNAAQYILDDLQYAQNRCLKICLGLHRLTDTIYVHCKAKIPMLANRRLTHLHNFMYKRAQNPDFLVRGTALTRANQGPVLRRVTAHGQTYFNSVEHFGAMAWNSLKPPVRLIPLHTQFKMDRRIWLKSMVPILLR